jgi:hypothetical protein
MPRAFVFARGAATAQFLYVAIKRIVAELQRIHSLFRRAAAVLRSRSRDSALKKPSVVVSVQNSGREQPLELAAELIEEPSVLIVPVPDSRTAGDYVHATVGATLGSVPGAGTALQTVFTTLVSTPLDRRRDAWMNSVNSRLLELEKRAVVNVQALSENEGFVSLLMRASDAALRTHDETKLDALRNAVVNSASAPEEPDDRELQFVRFVDELSGWHLRILAYLHNPVGALPAGHPVLHEPQRDIIAGVLVAVPELSDREAMVGQLYEDMVARRLVVHGGVKVRPGLPAIAKRTTAIGDEFLDYVLTEHDHPESSPA